MPELAFGFGSGLGVGMGCSPTLPLTWLFGMSLMKVHLIMKEPLHLLQRV